MENEKPEEPDPLTQIPGQKEFPPYKPIAYFGGNLLLGGLSYIMLRQYKRFFAFLGLLFVTALIPMIGNLLGYAILFGSCFDAYSIARKLKDKSMPEPEYNRTLTYVAVAIWIVLVILMIASMVLVSQNPASLY